MTGMLASSKAGHDRNNIYVIIKEEAEYIYLVDGKSRTIEKPKKKNKKHIQIIKKCPDANLLDMIKSGKADDVIISKYIHKYEICIGN